MSWSPSAPPSTLISQCEIFHVSKRWWKFGFCVKSQFTVDKVIPILKVLCESTPELGSSLGSQSIVLILETVDSAISSTVMGRFSTEPALDLLISYLLPPALAQTKHVSYSSHRYNSDIQSNILWFCLASFNKFVQSSRYL